MADSKDYESYRQFLDFVSKDCQNERSKTNRKMFWVFIWCFLLPALSLGLTMIFIHLGWFPIKFRRYLDWLVLVFPVTYSLYYLGVEVLIDVPTLFKKGGMASTLRQAHRDALWRKHVTFELKQLIPVDQKHWHWIRTSYQIDLDNLKSRIRYITILSGAVFFLVTQILDAIGEPSHKEIPLNGISGGFFLLSRLESLSSNLSQVAGTLILLVLFYLSGNQTVAVLKRYQDCLLLLEDEQS